MKNSINKFVGRSAVLGLSALMLSAIPVLAQDNGEEIGALAPDVNVDLKKLTCWEVVTLNEDDRSAALTLLYGNIVGAKGQSVISPQNSQVAIVAAITECVDTPDASIYVLMEKKIAE
jgi:HdeA/HdeB family